MARFGLSWRVVGVVVLLGLAGGCHGPGQPKGRMGALPFPGMFTLFTTADPQRLGHHGDTGVFGSGVDRGIVYTKEAGFVDVAHIRDTIDWTRYSVRHVRKAIDRGDKTLALRMKNLTWMQLRFNYPADWKAMSDAERRAVVDEVSVRVGQEVTYYMMTWHEVLTWYGYRGTFLFDESQSAFTYDDILSHVIGVTVAGEAVRRAGLDVEKFDDAVTELLDESMRSLGAVSPAETERAVEAVRGKWWDGGKPIRRQVEVGLASGSVRPWLVEEMSGQTEGREFEVPRLGVIAGRDFSGFYEVEIDSRSSVTEHIRTLVPGRPARFAGGKDLEVVLGKIEEEVKQNAAVMAAGR